MGDVTAQVINAAPVSVLRSAPQAAGGLPAIFADMLRLQRQIGNHEVVRLRAAIVERSRARPEPPLIRPGPAVSAPLVQRGFMEVMGRLINDNLLDLISRYLQYLVTRRELDPAVATAFEKVRTVPVDVGPNINIRDWFRTVGKDFEAVRDAAITWDTSASKSTDVMPTAPGHMAIPAPAADGSPVASPPPTKRSRDDEDSEMEASDDDATTFLDPKGTIALSAKKAKRQQQHFENEKIEKDKDGVWILDTPRSRKAFAFHRLNSRNNTDSGRKSKALVDINKTHTVRIGHTLVNIDAGTGHYIIAAGGAKPAGLKEPPADYASIFTQLKGMGSDANAAPLCKLATGSPPRKLGELSEQELASIALYFLNQDAGEIAKSCPRTQLTETLAKLTAVTAIAEYSRSSEAESGAYDATDFVKVGLAKIQQGKSTFETQFYKGTGGRDSVFLGAPSEKYSGISGAAELRAPLTTPRLATQSIIFDPSAGSGKPTKRDIKAAFNAVRTKIPPTPVKLTEKDHLEAAELQRQGDVARARKLKGDIKALTVPTNVNDVNEFLNVRHPGITKAKPFPSSEKPSVPDYRSAIRFLREQCKGNEDALAELTAASDALEQKAEAALKAL